MRQQDFRQLIAMLRDLENQIAHITPADLQDLIGDLRALDTTDPQHRAIKDSYQRLRRLRSSAIGQQQINTRH
jgi:hypothetical protein